MVVNNVTRWLDGQGVAYQAYELPVEKLGAVEAAQHLGVSPDEVFKTIVVVREGRGKPLLAVTPGSLEVDLKALAKGMGEKKLDIPAMREAERLTGLLAGGISPLALIGKGFQVVIDETAQLFDQIYISGGQRGLNICLAPEDLRRLTQATYVDFAR